MENLKIVLIIGSILLAIILIYNLVWFFRYKKGIDTLVFAFKTRNCIVFGKKGTGKDLVFNAVINKRNELAYSNMYYNRKLTQIKQIKDFSCEPNTFENLVNNEVQVCNKNIKEGVDFYISDGGIYLPSQYSHLLCRLYPSLPIFYALSRQLANMNIHINTQALNRVWDKLREQADAYFKVVKTHKTIFGNYITEIIYYELYESAKAGILPFEKSLISSAEESATYKDFKAKHGTVERFYIKQKQKDLKYDTRYFHKLMYGVRAPNNN